MDIERGRSFQRRPPGGPLARAAHYTTRALAAAGTLGPGLIAGALGGGRPGSRTPISPPMSRSRSPSRGRKRFRSRSPRRSRSRSRSNPMSVTTEQRDSAIRYRRGLFTRRGRAQRTFAARVRGVFLRASALQCFSDVNNANKTVTAAQQQWDGYLVAGTTCTDNDALFQAFRLAYGSSLTTATIDDYQLYIKVVCTDFQFTNTGSTTLVFDFYSLMCRKSYNVAEQLAIMIATLQAETPAQTGFTFTSTDPGYSLFQNSLFCQYWSILRKWQVQLGAGETTTLQIRVPVNRRIQGKTIETNPQGIPGLTRGLMWSCKGAPFNNAGTPTTNSGTYTWCSQTTVSYVIPPTSQRAQIASF